jgi:hypothetical protein
MPTTLPSASGSGIEPAYEQIFRAEAGTDGQFVAPGQPTCNPSMTSEP